MSVCYNCFLDKYMAGPCPHCGFDIAGQAEKYPLALRPGSILNGRYIVGRVLGQGGFGITYVTLDDRTGERIAIKKYLPMELAVRNENSAMLKVYSGERRDNFEYGKQQFHSEAETLAEFIGVDNIVRIHSYFEENATAYFAMEFVDGQALDKYMTKRGGRLDITLANELLLPVMAPWERYMPRESSTVMWRRTTSSLTRMRWPSSSTSVRPAIPPGKRARALM